MLYASGEDIAETVSAAQDADAVIVFAQEWRSEALDAQGLALSAEQNRLIETLAAANRQIVVVLETGGAVAMPWLDKVPAVVEAWYAGSGGGEAIAGVLLGRVNPSGRLPITFPASEAQLPRPEQTDPAGTTSLPGAPVKGGIIHIDYDMEGSGVGYRWFARTRQTPLFPFGYGLSYTSFNYKALRLAEEGDVLYAILTLANSGDRAGAEVAQIYIRPASQHYAPRLAAFARVDLQPGESQEIRLRLEPKVIACWETENAQWTIHGKDYQILAGKNAMEFVLETVAHLQTRRFGY
ncbi:glycoside hydrolase family 3 C-terminal domain-containing protein [Pantoea sp.]|uniref:glycoside hydrolase family 3 C-terminal domain-containing protein n=1 Tax=Pantoea sp. TaxID=69393 RepID=UPI002897CE9F|nr:glycoside hydrolase family 3 C-terminal domain-containing protein [Pantoea sp.]